jgi:hypothetical protein
MYLRIEIPSHPLKLKIVCCHDDLISQTFIERLPDFATVSVILGDADVVGIARDGWGDRVGTL